MKKIYFAGGWFNPAQEEEHTRIFNFLSQNKELGIFNPRTSGGEFKASTETEHMSKVLLHNCAAIVSCDLVVAITDYKDMGTLWECGYAYAAEKPIIYYCETLGDKPFNLMLAKTGMVAKNMIELNALLRNEKSYIFKLVHSYKGEIE